MMKRIRQSDEAYEITNMANYLILLSAAAGGGGAGGDEYRRVFTCKTCDRQFSSFQALGGHRASHKKPRMTADGHRQPAAMSPPKATTHECPVCGLEFPIGQALGGHMRRHRTAAAGNRKMEGNHDENGRKILLGVDLNLTPLENKINVPAVVHCFF